MLVLKTQNHKAIDPDWVKVIVGEREFRITAMINRSGNNKNAAVLVIDADEDIKFYRETLDNKGNK